jgi:hypothetical protein
MLVVSSFAVVAAVLAVFIAMPVSARAAMPSSAHRIRRRRGTRESVSVVQPTQPRSERLHLQSLDATRA